MSKKADKEYSGTNITLAAAQHAADAVQDLFDVLCRYGLEQKAAHLDNLMNGIEAGEISVEARLQYNRDGIQAIQFYSIMPGNKPEQIMYVNPKMANVH